MSVRIRLRRTGTKKKPMYRIVVADSRYPREGRFIEILGFYNPRTSPATIEVNKEKAEKWLKNGASPSERVHKLFSITGIMEAPVQKPAKEKIAPPPEPATAEVKAAAPVAEAAPKPETAEPSAAPAE